MSSVRQPLKVPESYRAGFVALARLPEAAYQSLAQSLSKQAPALLPQVLSARIHGDVPALVSDSILEILNSVLSLFEVAQGLGIDTSELATEVAGSPALELSEGERSALGHRVVALLNSEALFLTSKSLGLLTNNERNFHSARIVSDIRPVFATDVHRLPETAVLVHRLSVTFHTASGLDDIEFALDSRDLSVLSEAVARAVDKAQTLKEMWISGNRTLLDPVEEFS